MPAPFRSQRTPKVASAYPKKAPANQGRRLVFEDLEARQVMAIAGLGVAGDSWSDDEYAGQNYDQNAATNTAFNWVDLLRGRLGVDLGPNGPFLPTTENPFESRDQGTAFNWAVTGASSLDLLLQAQDIGIIDQFEANDVSHAVLMAGNVDLQPNSRTTVSSDDFKDAYAKIYLGTFDATEIEQFVVIPITSNIEVAVSPLISLATKSLVATIPDPGVSPHAVSEFPDPTKRALVTAVINTINTRIKAIAAKYHAPVVDLAKLSETIFGTAQNPVATRTIGGRIFDNAAGNAKTNLYFNPVGSTNAANVPHTVYQAHIANLIIEGLNTGYGENLAKFTEQQIVQLAGQTYGGTDTFNVNYRSMVTLPPVTIYVDFGQSITPTDDFSERMKEVAAATGNIAQLSIAPGGELATLKANIVSRVQAAFSGMTVNVTGTRPADTRYETIKVGRIPNSVPGPLTSPLGQGSFDWLNANETSIGFVFPNLITTNLSAMTRANQLRYLENILTFYITQEAGRGLGLSASDAYSYSQITNANYTNTAGVQLQDFMLGQTSLGFSQTVFDGTPTFKFSPLSLAKMQMGHWLNSAPIATVAEVATAHATTATAQAVALTTTSGNASFKVGAVKGATIATGGQKDLYKITLAADDLLTAQTVATGVYGDSIPPAIDTIIKVFAADGTTLLYESDNTLLGTNSIGQTGTTKFDDDSLAMNFKATTAGDYFVEVTAKSGSTGSYDLVLGATIANAFPWRNPENHLNVNNSTGPTPITAFDALIIINELNAPQVSLGGGVLPAPGGPQGPPPYFDVFADNKVTAFDALLVINFLNLNPIGSGGEAIIVSESDNSSPFVPFSAPTSANNGSAGEAINDEISLAVLPNESAAELLLLNRYVVGTTATDDIECSHSEVSDVALEELLAEVE